MSRLSQATLRNAWRAFFNTLLGHAVTSQLLDPRRCVTSLRHSVPLSCFTGGPATASMPWRSPRCGSPSGARPSLRLERSRSAMRRSVSLPNSAALTLLRLCTGLGVSASAFLACDSPLLPGADRQGRPTLAFTGGDRPTAPWPHADRRPVGREVRGRWEYLSA